MRKEIIGIWNAENKMWFHTWKRNIKRIKHWTKEMYSYVSPDGATTFKYVTDAAPICDNLACSTAIDWRVMRFKIVNETSMQQLYRPNKVSYPRLKHMGLQARLP